MKKLSFDKDSIFKKQVVREPSNKVKKELSLRLPKIKGKRGQMGGFLNLFMGLMFAYMILAVLVALVPAFKDLIISATSYSTGLNCVGAADYNATAAQYTGGTSGTACLALGLFIPFVVFAILMAIIGKILYDRGAPTPGYG